MADRFGRRKGRTGDFRARKAAIGKAFERRRCSIIRGSFDCAVRLLKVIERAQNERAGMLPKVRAVFCVFRTHQIPFSRTSAYVSTFYYCTSVDSLLQFYVPFIATMALRSLVAYSVPTSHGGPRSVATAGFPVWVSRDAPPAQRMPFAVRGFTFVLWVIQKQMCLTPARLLVPGLSPRLAVFKYLFYLFIFIQVLQNYRCIN